MFYVSKILLVRSDFRFRYVGTIVLSYQLERRQRLKISAYVNTNVVFCHRVRAYKFKT